MTAVPASFEQDRAAWAGLGRPRHEFTPLIPGGVSCAQCGFGRDSAYHQPAGSPAGRCGHGGLCDQRDPGCVSYRPPGPAPTQAQRAAERLRKEAAGEAGRWHMPGPALAPGGWRLAMEDGTALEVRARPAGWPAETLDGISLSQVQAALARCGDPARASALWHELTVEANTSRPADEGRCAACDEPIGTAWVHADPALDGDHDARWAPAPPAPAPLAPVDRRREPGQVGIPYAWTNPQTGARTCPECQQVIAETYDDRGDCRSQNYALHYERDHAPAAGAR